MSNIIASQLETYETNLVNAVGYPVVRLWWELVKNHYPASEDRILDNLQPNPNKSPLHSTIRTGDGSPSLAQLTEAPYDSGKLPFRPAGPYPISFFQSPPRSPEPVGQCPKKRNFRDRSASNPPSTGSCEVECATRRQSMAEKSGAIPRLRKRHQNTTNHTVFVDFSPTQNTG